MQTAVSTPRTAPVHRGLVTLSVMIGTFMEVLDTSVANVALPHIRGSFSSGQDEITWVITSYLVANAIILPLSGWIGNYFGRKRAYLWCLALFNVASLGAGLSTSLGMMVLMRIIQGLAGGAMVPMSQAILLEEYPPEEHGKAMAMFGVGVVFAPIVGPTLGGWLTDVVGWRWVFYINVPMGIVGLLLGIAYIVDPPYMRRPEGRIDAWSFVFLAIGLGCLEVMLNRGERYDWFHSPRIQVLALLSALGVALFVWRSFTAARPLVDLRVFRSREFATGTVLMFLLGFGLYGAFTYLPLYVQTLQGYTALLAGLLLSPGGISSLISMAVVGALVARFDVRLLIAFGAALNVWAMYWMQHISPDAGFSYMVMSRIIQGFGLGFLFVPLTAVAFVKLRPEQIGGATGLFNLMRNEGGSIGVAISSTVLSQHVQVHHARLAEHIRAGNPILQERFRAMSHALTHAAGVDPATGRALAWHAIGGQIQLQSATIAYVDIFWMLMLSFVLFLPLVLLLPGKGQAGTAIH